MAADLYPNVSSDGTPTKVSETTDIETWVTKTSASTTVEYRPKPGGPTALAAARDVRITAAVATLRQWATTARATTVTTGNNNAVTQGLVDNAGKLYDNLADLIEALGKN
jgi:hypothetical protein